MSETRPLLSVEAVTQNYREGDFLFPRQRPVLRGVSFSIREGESVALLGPSGEGKSTLSRILLGLEAPASGRVLFEGLPLPLWRKQNPGGLSAVFQDSAAAVDPRWTIRRIVTEPLAILGRETEGTVPSDLLEAVGLPASFADRYPHELSGGQLQRVCLARALSTRPRFAVFDEAVSSLDVAAQSRILALLKELSQGMAFLFITHDIEAAASLCHRILFMEGGVIAEDIETARLKEAKSAIARRLLASALPF